jgi:hypothetical protein
MSPDGLGPGERPGGHAPWGRVHIRERLPSKPVNAIFNIQSRAPPHEERAGWVLLG